MRSEQAEQRVCRQLIEAWLFERITPFYETTDGDRHQFILPCKEGEIHATGVRSAFDRVRLQALSFVEKERRTPVSLKELIARLELPEVLAMELAQTVFLSKWNAEHLPLAERRGESYEALESLLIEGHPYHPCFKSRTGFSLEDHKNYGPECGASFPVIWVACPSADVTVSDAALIRKEADRASWSEWQKLARSQGICEEAYVLIPVHPWQWEKVADQAIQSGVIEVGTGQSVYRATQSVRTVWNEHDPEADHLKLPIAMAHTSSVRTFNPEAVAAAPVISGWLATIADQDPALSEMIILKEHKSVMYEPDSAGLTGQIGAIWRESVTSHLRQGERAIPLNALSVIEPDGKPFCAPWLQQYGAEIWLQRLLQLVVVPAWRLFLHHGIAIEAHAQNGILIVRDGWPVRIAWRDFHDSTEYVRTFLKEPDLCPDFQSIHPRFHGGKEDEFYWMSSVEGLRELMMDTLFVFHLTELSYALDRSGLVAEHEFWECVKRLLSESEMDPAREALASPYKKTIRAEALLTKKLAAQGEYHHVVGNELADERRKIHAVHKR